VKRIYILIAMIAAYLILAELALEIRDVSRGYHAVFFDWVKSATKMYCEFNSPNDLLAADADVGFPFRSKYVEPLKRPGVKRIWILSSSYAEDIYIPMEEVWPNRLDFILEATRPGRFEVINAAKAGMDMTDGLNKLSRYYPIYVPDIIVSYNMTNDITKIARKSFSVANSSNIPASVITHWSDNIINNTTLYAKAVTTIRTRVISGKILADSLDYKETQSYDKSIEKLREFCYRKGIVLVMCTVATRDTKNSSYKKIAEDIRFLFASNPYLSAIGWVVTVDELNGRLRGIDEDKNTKIVDLAKDISGQDSLFRDFIHFTREGHMEVAKKLAGVILEIVE
jgi:hypothetical protein